MRVDLFDFELPPELVAQAPAPERAGARMLRVPADGAFQHAKVRDLAEYVAPGTLVVVNDTRVVKARILGEKEGTGGRTEIFLVRRVASEPTDDVGVATYDALARASKGVKPGARIRKGPLTCEVLGRNGDDGLVRVRLTTPPGTSVDDAIRAVGEVPLPPYIKRAPSADDEARYQTVFARVDGSVAAPTAGLHLTEEMLGELTARGCEIARVTLHVGLGTFKPVTAADLDDHAMHSEAFEITPDVVASVARARERRAPVLAVGTTVVRALESAKDASRPGHVRACAEETRLLIQPGYRFAIVDRLFTNFHLPKSTLLALVCAFGGHARVLDAYRAAVRDRYRFFSYGDAMLVDPAAEASA